MMVCGGSGGEPAAMSLMHGCLFTNSNIYLELPMSRLQQLFGLFTGTPGGQYKLIYHDLLPQRRVHFWWHKIHSKNLILNTQHRTEQLLF